VTDTGAHRETDAHRRSLTHAVPLIGQLSGYPKLALGRDAVAALGVAATLVPQALAYGHVAGLAPAAGLYTAVGAALVFSLVTSTRFVVVAPSSTLAVMTFEAVHGPAADDPRKAAALAGCLAVLVGLLCVASPLLRMQKISNLLSEPVMLGYLAGSAVVIFAGQIGVLLGVSARGEGALSKLWYVLTHLGQAHACCCDGCTGTAYRPRSSSSLPRCWPRRCSTWPSAAWPWSGSSPGVCSFRGSAG
jgi:SulP family sulfate permease